MVYYFKSSTGNIIYVGKNKYENEDLIKYSWPEDIWFHVDNLSSAHVYLRLDERVSDLTQLDPRVSSYIDNNIRMLRIAVKS